MTKFVDELVKCINENNTNLLDESLVPLTEVEFNATEFLAILAILKQNFVIFELQKRQEGQYAQETIDELKKHLDLLCYKVNYIPVIGQTINKEIRKTSRLIYQLSLDTVQGPGIGSFIECVDKLQDFKKTNVEWTQHYILQEIDIIEDATREFQELSMAHADAKSALTLLKTFLLCLKRFIHILNSPDDTKEYIEYSDSLLEASRQTSARIDDFVFIFDEEGEGDALNETLVALKEQSDLIVGLLSHDLAGDNKKWVDLCTMQFDKILSAFNVL